MDLIKQVTELVDELEAANEENKTLEDRISELEESNSELLSENDNLDSENDDLQAELDTIRNLLASIDCEDEDDLEEFEYRIAKLEEFHRQVCRIFGLSPDTYNNVWSLVSDIKAKYNEHHSRC